jgi:hypothetical protein
MYYKLIITLPILFLFFSCSSKEATDSTITGDKPVNRLPAVSPIPPNHARISAEVISIHVEMDENNPDTPCGKIPCSATLKVNQILGYGPSTEPIIPGAEIAAWFSFTTGPTDEYLFPGLSKHLTGVKEGDSLIALIRFSASRAAYVINDYQIIN